MKERDHIRDEKHWRCTQCGYRTPIDKMICGNPSCRAELRIYGVVVDPQGKSTTKPPPPLTEEPINLPPPGPGKPEREPKKKSKAWISLLVVLLLLLALVFGTGLFRGDMGLDEPEPVIKNPDVGNPAPDDADNPPGTPGQDTTGPAPANPTTPDPVPEATPNNPEPANPTLLMCGSHRT